MSAPMCYVCNSDAPTSISVIDTETDALVTNISIDPFPNYLVITPDGSKVYVTCGSSNNVSVITAANNTVSKIIAVGDDPERLAITPDGSKVYVVTDGSGSGNVIYVIDTLTDTVETTITIDSVFLAITPDGSKVYITDNSSNVSVINTSTNTVESNIDTGNSNTELVITPDGSKVYITNPAGSVSVISTANNMFATIPITGSPIRLTVTPDGSKVYVFEQVFNSIYVIDTATESPQFVDMLGFSSEYLAATPNNQKVYVATGGGGNLFVIDTSSETVSSIPEGFIQRYLAITSDSKKVYVSNPFDNSVSVIDALTDTVLTKIAVELFPVFLAITPAPRPPPPPPPPSPPSPPPPPSPPSNVLPPLDLTGQQIKNSSGLEYELFNTLRWQANPNATGVIGYLIYRDGSLIAQLNASTFQYEDHNRKKGESNLYSIVSFAANGSQSVPISIMVIPK